MILSRHEANFFSLGFSNGALSAIIRVKTAELQSIESDTFIFKPETTYSFVVMQETMRFAALLKRPRNVVMFSTTRQGLEALTSLYRYLI